MIFIQKHLDFSICFLWGIVGAGYSTGGGGEKDPLPVPLGLI